MFARLAAKLQRKGFVGPYYAGARGKLRFLLESTVARQEIIFVASPESFAAAPSPSGPPLELHPIRTFSDFDPFRAEVEAEFYPGYTDSWRDPFTWGEEAVIGTVEGRTASYNWMQFGTREGFPTYYGRMFDNEARILRGGVLPSSRRGGLNTLMKYRLLERFFASGVARVYAECYKYNLPSVRTLLRIGFRPVGLLSIVELPGLRGFVRWEPTEELHRVLREIRIEEQSPVAAGMPEGAGDSPAKIAGSPDPAASGASIS